MSPAVARDAPLPLKGDYILWDSRTRYLGLRVNAGGTKAWIVQKKLSDSPCKYKLGDFPDMTYTKACSLVADVVAKIAKGIDPNLEKRQQIRETSKMRAEESFTVAKCLYEYIDDKSTGGNPPKPLTTQDWNRSLNRIEADAVGSLPLVALTGSHLADYYDAAAKKAKRHTTNGGRTQAGRDLRYLRAAYNFGALKYQLNAKVGNPFEELNKLRKGWYAVRAKTNIVATVEGDLASWWVAVEGLRQQVKPWGSRDVIADYLQLALLWGGRRGETMSLTWDNINLKDGIVSIFAEDTKNSLKHVFPLTRYARLILERRYDINEKRAEPSPWVFPSHKLNRQGVLSHIVATNSAVTAVVKACGRDFSEHDLRRTFGTIFNELGLGDKSVRKALNHAADDTASKYYIQARIAKIRPIYQQYEDNLLVEAGVIKAPMPKIEVSGEQFAQFQAWLAAQGASG